MEAHARRLLQPEELLQLELELESELELELKPVKLRMGSQRSGLRFSADAGAMVVTHERHRNGQDRDEMDEDDEADYGRE